MDDIARDLGISKKTIYQYFTNKSEIVREVSRVHFRQEECEVNKISLDADNAVDELVRIIKWTTQAFSNIAPNLIFEMQKFYPDSWKIFEDHKSGFVLQKVRENLKRGISEGVYRADIQIEVVSRIRISQIELGFREDIFPPSDFDQIEVQIQILKLYLYGLTTEKGRKLIDIYLNNN
jgi:AcrR family transcriptional regulator